MPRHAQPKDNSLLEMAIVGYQHEVERLKAIADIKAQLGQRGPGQGHGIRDRSRGPAEAARDEQGGPRQDRRRAEGEMGGAEKATGATGHIGEAQEAEAIGGGVESHQGSHEEALGGLP